MQGTRWAETLRRSAAMLHRELRISLTPLPHPRKWVFVVGCYNSGTTLLSGLLGAHEQISALPTEGQFLTDQFAADHELGLPRMWCRREDLYRLTEDDPGPDVVRLKREWGMRLDRSKPILLEKSPPNSVRMRWLQKHFENAHFIAIIRNGYAVAEGIARKAEPVHTAGGWSIEQCAEQWRRANEMIEADAEHLDHLMWLRYEDLAEDPQREIGRVMSFLELEDARGIDLSQRWSVHERAERIRNLNAESIARLSDADIATVERVAGDALAHFGYPLLSQQSRAAGA